MTVKIFCSIIHLLIFVGVTTAKTAKVPPKLVAEIHTYPGLNVTDSRTVTGSATVQYNPNKYSTNPNTTFLVKFDLTGLEAFCSGCGIHITNGTTCEDAALVGKHYWKTASDLDPWPAVGKYDSDANGQAKGQYVMSTSGVSYDDIVGHPVVIHRADNTRVGCGILKPLVGILSSDNIGNYPGNTSPYSIRGGKVKLYFLNDNTIHFTYNIKGGDPACVTGCGVHIHSGTSCANATLVGGHYWTPMSSPDPWNFPQVMWYLKLRKNVTKSVAKGSFFTSDGYNLTANNGHAIVFHQKDGGRIGCGTLSKGK